MVNNWTSFLLVRPVYGLYQLLYTPVKSTIIKGAGGGESQQFSLFKLRYVTLTKQWFLAYKSLHISSRMHTFDYSEQRIESLVTDTNIPPAYVLMFLICQPFCFCHHFNICLNIKQAISVSTLNCIYMHPLIQPLNWICVW